MELFIFSSRRFGTSPFFSLDSFITALFVFIFFQRSGSFPLGCWSYFLDSVSAHHRLLFFLDSFITPFFFWYSI